MLSNRYKGKERSYEQDSSSSRTVIGEGNIYLYQRKKYWYNAMVWFSELLKHSCQTEFSPPILRRTSYIQLTLDISFSEYKYEKSGIFWVYNIKIQSIFIY